MDKNSSSHLRKVFSKNFYFLVNPKLPSLNEFRIFYFKQIKIWSFESFKTVRDSNGLIVKLFE